MPAFELEPSIVRAQARFDARARLQRPRLDEAVDARLREILRAQDRPRPLEAWHEVRAFCARRGLPSPSRAAARAAVDRVEPSVYESAALPAAVQRCLHNVASGAIPGHQVAFAAFNYGDTRTMCFAAGLPWPCLRAATRLPGFRPRSRALLEAVLARRGI
jgi:hypothetical protein